jgi:excisionase family DNA binding protein
MRLSETNLSVASSSPFTTREAARELGFSESSILKVAAELGGYRQGARGHYRFPRSAVLAFKGREAELRQPTATLARLRAEFDLEVKLTRGRLIEVECRVEALQERLAKLEERTP